MNPTLLKELVSRGIEEEVKKAFDLKMEELNKKKNEICAGILLNVMKYVEVQKMGENLVFTLREIKK